jgi:hypothetical protein
MEPSPLGESPPLWYIGHHETTRVVPVNNELLNQAQEANVSLPEQTGKSCLLTHFAM